MDKKTTDLIIKTTEELLTHLSISAEINLETGEDEVVYLNLETEESGILIGYHGETLYSFQLILGLIIYRKLGKWIRIVVNVGDYRQKRKEALEQMADNYASKAIQDQEPLVFPYLNSAERRIIHLHLKDNKEVETESQGEGSSRRLVIKPK